MKHARTLNLMCTMAFGAVAALGCRSMVWGLLILATACLWLWMLDKLQQQGTRN